MDFPSSLRPTLFKTGPLGLSDVPDLSFMCSWRDILTLPEYQPRNSENRASDLAKDLVWEPVTPGPLPLLRPAPDPWDPGLTAQDLLFRGGYQYRKQPRVVLDVTEQLSRFLWDHGEIAFAPLGKLMLENFKLEGAGSRTKKKTVINVKTLFKNLGGHQPWGQVSLGLHHPPTAPVLRPRGPYPGQVGGEPLGRAAARGAGSTMGAVASGRGLHRGRVGLGAWQDAPRRAAGLSWWRHPGHAVYPSLLSRRSQRAPGGGDAVGVAQGKGRSLGACSDHSSCADP
uniref:TATA box-binding protein-associated factor RNA polymerase I subunit C n=1 Tax=Prolemur simus TaxID=1328070 RepID=A0A8C8Z1Q7_PROSS